MLGESPAAGTVPVPERLRVCGLPGALSAIDNAAERAPAAVGANVTLTVQLAPAIKEPAQLSFSLKSVGLLPIRLRLLMYKVALPVLVTVTFCALLVVPTF